MTSVALEAARIAEELDRLLLPWFAAARRDLPWRRTRDPYAIWVSEVMLQQTRVDTVLRYYHRFLDRFPTVASLAAASMDDVLKAWEGMGYYTRARNLHRAARAIGAGDMPRSLEGMLAVPGIGRYSAGAVLSIAHGLPHAVVDGNVRRVLSRLFAEDGDPRLAETQRRLWARAEALMSERDPSAHNQALIELGAVVCKPRGPACPACPVSTLCRARAMGTPERFPTRPPRPPLPQREVAAAVLDDGAGRFLLRRRPERGLLGGLWELPGEERREEESLEEACRRAARSVGHDVPVGPALPKVTHTFTHFRMHLHPFRCPPRSGDTIPISIAEIGMVSPDLVRWVSVDEARQMALPRAQQRVLDLLGEVLW